MMATLSIPIVEIVAVEVVAEVVKVLVSDVH